MKLASFILILCFSIGFSQETLTSEKVVRDLANSYFEAWDSPTYDSLSEEDKIYLKSNDEIDVQKFCASKAYYYYSQLILNFPNSTEYQCYLYRNGLMALNLSGVKNDAKYEDARTSFLKAIKLNQSNYYTKLSLYNLVIIYDDENNCQAAKKYISILNTVNLNLLNEYQNDYIATKIKDITNNCSN